jgi:hypothetical protein
VAKAELRIGPSRWNIFAKQDSYIRYCRRNEEGWSTYVSKQEHTRVQLCAVTTGWNLQPVVSTWTWWPFLPKSVLWTSERTSLYDYRLCILHPTCPSEICTNTLHAPRGDWQRLVYLVTLTWDVPTFLCAFICAMPSCMGHIVGAWSFTINEPFANFAPLG